MNIDAAKVKEIKSYTRKRFAALYDGRSHPSHAAAKAMEEAEKFFELPTYGVEGWSTASGRNGIQYLNTGDMYDRTLVARSRPDGVQFMWAEVASFA